MTATRRPTRLACFTFACALALAGLAPFARAQAPEKPEQVTTIGPQVALSAEQLLAIEAKRAADPGALAPPRVAAAAIKLSGVPSLAPARVRSAAGAVSAEARSKLLAATDPPSVAARSSSWRSVISKLGPIPRAEWVAPWSPAKPADVTIARPLPAKDASSQAPPAVSPGDAH